MRLTPRAMDLAASMLDRASDCVSIETKMETYAARAPPGRALFRARISPRDTAPSSCLRDSANHRR